MSTPVMVTLNQIKEYRPCSLGWRCILSNQVKTTADDVEFPLVDAFKSNSISDVIWALRCIERKYIAVSLANYCCERTESLLQRAQEAYVGFFKAAPHASTDTRAAINANAYAADALAACTNIDINTVYAIYTAVSAEAMMDAAMASGDGNIHYAYAATSARAAANSAQHNNMTALAIYAEIHDTRGFSINDACKEAIDVADDKEKKLFKQYFINLLS